MKIVHFTNNTFDGAGRAAYTLHCAMRRLGEDSLMLVYRKDLKDESVQQVVDGHPIRSAVDIIKEHIRFIRFCWHKLVWKMLQKQWQKSDIFNFNYAFVGLERVRKYIEKADVICLHSVQSFLSPKLIRQIYEINPVPVIWTTMDIEPVTGGCHFNDTCFRFKDQCGLCPQLKKPAADDISHNIWQAKRDNFKGLPITLVAPTSWAYERIAQSSLFKNNRIKKILIGVEDQNFFPGDKQKARVDLGIPQSGKVVAFGCFDLGNKRKGGEYLLNALRLLADHSDPSVKRIVKDLVLVTFGRKGTFDLGALPVKWIHLGELKNNEKVNKVYQAADCLAVPSLDDCGPMMINEGFACEVPIVAFASGVGPDLIVDPQAGYLAKKYEVEDLARGIIHCLNIRKGADNETVAHLRSQVRPKHQAKMYIQLFQELLQKNEPFVTQKV